MTTDELIKGLQILQPYYDNPGEFNTGTGYDVVYAYPTNKPVSEEDILKMVELDWDQEHDYDEGEDELSLSDYRQDESWVFFT